MAERNAERNKVLRSIETPEGDRCVDIFQRADGTFGYAVYRRDVEDGRGWFPLSSPSQASDPSAEAALRRALAEGSWLKDAIGSTT